MAQLGLDFGTSNTAAGVMVGNRPQPIALEPGQSTLPTAVFVDFVTRNYVYGSSAARMMMDGQEGRFMRGLKSILGTPLAREKRRLLNERVTLIDVIAQFLDEIRRRSEAETGQSYDRVLSGRPVHFHSASPDRDSQAEADLTEAYHLAGFKQVAFLPEPEAAALAVAGEGRMLIVDIGGGTSDFTLCDRRGTRTEVLASGGLRLGGTDFDRILGLAHAMPLLGYGAEIGAELGSNTMTAPRALYHDLASWEKIAFVYDPSLLRDVRKWVRLARTPALFERLAHVLESHLGHDIAYAVEAGKISANDGGSGSVDLGVIEPGLSARITREVLDTALVTQAEAISDTALATLARAGCEAASVGTVVFVGGSSLMGVIRESIGRALPQARQEESAVFTAVVDGLAIAAAGGNA